MNGFFWAVLAALIWGIVPLLESLGLTKTEPFVGLFYRCLGVLIGFLLLGIFVVKPLQIKSVDLRSILLLVCAGFLASIVGQICFYHGLKSDEVSKVVPIAGSFPMVTFILGVLFLGESVTLMKTAGVLLITLGIWALKIG